MNLLVLEEVRNLYIDRVSENNNRKQLLKELEKLKKNKAVRRYLEIVNMGDVTIFSDEDIIKNIFKEKDIANKINCNIYVYYGFYKNGKRLNYNIESLDNKDGVVDYFVYVNIINNKVLYFRNIEEDKLFRSKNNIIEIGLSNYDEFRFYTIQNELYRRLLDGSDDKGLLDFLDDNKDKYQIKNIVRGKVRSYKKKVLVGR